MNAGDAIGRENIGGSVILSSGDGKTDGQYNSGGSGGHLYLLAGHGEGVNDDGDGGSVSISAGNSIHANGGHIVLKSGSSEQLTSGSIGKKALHARYSSQLSRTHTRPISSCLYQPTVVDTANAGVEGDSGFIQLTTGHSDSSNSGSILIATGNAVDEQTIFPDTPTYKGEMI